MEDRRDSMEAPHFAPGNPFKPVAVRFSGARTRHGGQSALSPGARYAPEADREYADPANEPDAPYLGVQPTYDRQSALPDAGYDVNGVPSYLRRDAPAGHQPKHGAQPMLAPQSAYDSWAEMGWSSRQPIDQTLVMHHVAPDVPAMPYAPAYPPEQPYADFVAQASGQYPASAPAYPPEQPYADFAAQASGQYPASAPAYPPEQPYADFVAQASGQYPASVPAYPPEQPYADFVAQASGQYPASAPAYLTEQPYADFAAQASGQYPASGTSRTGKRATYDALGRPTQYYVPPEDEPPAPRERHSKPSRENDAPPAARQAREAPPEKRSSRTWRFVLTVACSLALIFCAIEIGRIVTNLWANERDVKERRSDYYQSSGRQLEDGASRVELLPPGETYAPTDTPELVATATPKPTPTGTPEPRISINDPLIAAVSRPQTEQTDDPAQTDAPVRTKLSTYPNNALRYTNPTFEEPLKENPDVVGRIVINDVLDEVIVWRNNIYYLTHTAQGSVGAPGAVFMDEKCGIQTPPENLLLRGQANVEGKVFHGLTLYGTAGADFVRAHKKIHVTTLYEDAYYDVFAVIHASNTVGAEDYFDYASRLSFASDEEMLAYVESVKRRSLYNFDIDVLASDRLLTLATLADGADAYSWVILARMAR